MARELNCPECGATFGHATGCSLDTSAMKPPAEWPEYKMREFHSWQDDRSPIMGSFQHLRDDVRDFLHERYSGNHEWAFLNKRGGDDR
jgi:hypothetical protein